MVSSVLLNAAADTLDEKPFAGSVLHHREWYLDCSS